MANYDNKLGEWFKRLEKSERDLKEKKQQIEQQPATPAVSQQPQAAQGSTWQPSIEQVIVEEPVTNASATNLAQVIEDKAVVVQTQSEGSFAATGSVEVIDKTPEPKPGSPSIFEESDVPPVEDFLTFLNRTGEAPTEETFPVVETSRNRGIGHLSEGTGDPRPITSLSDLGIPPISRPDVNTPEVVSESSATTPEEPTMEVIVPAPKPKRSARPQTPQSLQEKWDRLPHHLQTLFGVAAGEEIAQNSYKTFRESRGELIQRLLDPPITLEEAARVLNVCPTTVRRYTNRGILKHFRTAGNQRRFRLSDVLTFMETRGRAESAAEGDGD